MLIHPLPYKLLIFDIDGTLRSCFNANQPCPSQPGDWYLLPHVRETLEQYQWGTTHQYVGSRHVRRTIVSERFPSLHYV